MPYKPTTKSSQNTGFSKSVETIKTGSFTFRYLGQTPKTLENQIDLSVSGGTRPNELTATNMTVVAKTPTVQPKDNWGGGKSFSSGEEAPLIYSPTPVLELTATSTNGTISSPVLRKYSDSNYLMVVYRNVGSALTAGDLRIVLKSSLSNFVTLTSQTVALQGEWVYDIFKFQENGTTGVVFTGTPNFDSMTFDIVVPTNGDVIQVSKIYTAQDVASFPNADRTIIFNDKCVDDIALDLGLETFDKMCGLTLRDKIANGLKPTFSVTLKEPDLFLQSASWGTVVKVDDQPVDETRELIVTAGVISLGSAIGGTNSVQNIKNISIQGVTLASALSNDIDENQFYVDRNTGDITVSTIYNGATATVLLSALRVIENYSVKNLDLGILGEATIQFNDSGKTEYFRATAKLMPKAETKTKDSEFTYEYELSFLYNRGEQFTKAVF